VRYPAEFGLPASAGPNDAGSLLQSVMIAGTSPDGS